MGIEGADDAAIARAAEQLSRGELVAFPTETVYGLGADARSPEAVARIYEAKGRPAHNPLIVHLLGEEEARVFGAGWDARASALAAAFWPGPLTLVCWRSDRIPPIVAAGGPTVALRAPRHPVARALLAAFAGPIAAPSANRSNRVSPTTAAHVAAEFGAELTILDGGPAEVGLESTVLSLVEDPPRILRPGAITRSAIAALLGTPVSEKPPPIAPSTALPSPGMLARHYAPGRPVVLFSPGTALPGDPTVAVIRRGSGEQPPGGGPQRELPADPEGYARELYSALRWADRPGISAIWIELPPEGEAWTAVHDRLARAAS